MSSTLEPGAIRLPFRSVFVSNLVHYYVVLGFVDLTVVLMLGFTSLRSLVEVPLVLLGYAIPTMPFIAVAAVLVTWLPIRYAWLRRVVASAIYASFAFVGLTWMTQLLDRVTNQRGLWDLPIALAVLAGLIAGLAVKTRTQEPRRYRAASPPVV